VSANYPHILAKVLRGIWVITDSKFQAIESVLASRLAAEGTQESIMSVAAVDESASEPTFTGRTMIIPIHGIISKHCSMMEMASGGCDLDQVNAALEVADNDSTVDKIILDFRSPGGTITGIPETAARITALAEHKDVVAYTDSECCSGALWLAAMAPSFFCTESADVGSVGVYLALLDKSRMLEDMGVKVNAISAGKYKLSGAPFKPLTTEERAMFQADVDRIYGMFKAAVQLNREVPEEYCEGQVYMGQSAVNAGFCNGLVDDIQDLL